ncbi:MAG: HEAT repeat domain-containing protein, partial [Planctomycetota bacterium]
VGGPTTGDGDSGGPTSGGGGGPAPSGGGPSGPTTGGGGAGRPSSAAKGLGYEDWTFWWNFNKDDILQLKSAIKGTQSVTRSGTGLHAFGKKKSGSQKVVSATDAAIQDQIIPALRKMLDQDDLNFDIQSAAALALAKIGDQKVIPTLQKMARNEKGDYHRVVEESAALAFGLLNVDNDEVRSFLIETVSD